MNLERPSDAYVDLPIKEVDALYESNLIENEKSMEALEDAIDAWIYAKKHKDKLLSDNLLEATEFVLEIHKRLLRRLRKDIAGKLRTCDVWIGGQCKTYHGEGALRERLNDWLINSTPKDLLRKKTTEAREKLAMKWHVAFEEWHGFEDGNGRTGRILYQIHRLMLGLPIKVIEAKTKHEEYYPLFHGRLVSKEEFVDTMMKGITGKGL